MTRAIDRLLHEVADLLKRSAALKMQSHELFNTAAKLRHKAEALKDAEFEQSGPEASSEERAPSKV